MKSPLLSIIAAIGENMAIGKNNELLWHLPNDFKHFKKITSNHSILMGRKTYESIGKPLPNRNNIIISRKKDLALQGIQIVDSIENAIKLCADETEVFIIGGAEIYKQCFKYCDKMYLTVVHQSFQGDAFFPNFDISQWNAIHTEFHKADEKHAFAYTFQTLVRKN